MVYWPVCHIYKGGSYTSMHLFFFSEHLFPSDCLTSQRWPRSLIELDCLPFILSLLASSHPILLNQGTSFRRLIFIGAKLCFFRSSEHFFFIIVITLSVFLSISNVTVIRCSYTFYFFHTESVFIMYIHNDMSNFFLSKLEPLRN